VSPGSNPGLAIAEGASGEAVPVQSQAASRRPRVRCLGIGRTCSRSYSRCTTARTPPIAVAVPVGDHAGVLLLHHPDARADLATDLREPDSLVHAEGHLARVCRMRWAQARAPGRTSDAGRSDPLRLRIIQAGGRGVGRPSHRPIRVKAARSSPASIRSIRMANDHAQSSRNGVSDRAPTSLVVPWALR
jgi:hypothetical protein